MTAPDENDLIERLAAGDRAATRALGEIASPKAQSALMELLKKKAAR